MTLATKTAAATGAPALTSNLSARSLIAGMCCPYESKIAVCYFNASFTACIFFVDSDYFTNNLQTIQYI
jgi:hypothetical protein